ncbi:MAG: DUF563 domain-containing protein [Oscillatoria sp. SIO1A7]|nr:DUF563 domain-containing protein [Oscillatoria sp. SIO1A7]
MKIAFIDFSNWDYKVESPYQIPLGGSQSAMCYLAEALAGLGHEVFLFNNTSAPGLSRGVQCFSFHLVSARLLQSLDALIVLNVAGEGIELRKRLGKQTRLVLWTQQVPTLEVMEGLQDRATQEAYDRIVFVSEWQRHLYLEHFGLEPSRTAVLRNAIAPAFAGLFADRDRILPEKSKPPVLAYTSTPFRGLDLLVDIFPKIRAAVPGTRLKVFSSKKVYQLDRDSDESFYGALYDKCRQTEGVEYIGSLPQPELARELRSVTALAYANTFKETSCIAVVEAMASGCLVVTSDLAALPETSAGFARLVSVADVHSFSDVRDWQFSQNQDWQAYGDRFVQATVQLLRECDRAEVSENFLRRMVDYINSSCTWPVRGREWQQWLSEICDRTFSDSQSEPSLAEQLTRRAEVDFRSNNIEGAIATLKQSLEVNPDFAPTYNSLANCYQARGDVEMALEHYARAIKLNPNFVPARVNLGSMYYRQWRLEEAISCYQKAIEVIGAATGAKLGTEVTPPESGAKTGVWSKAVAEDTRQTPPLRLRSGHAFARGGKEAPLNKGGLGGSSDWGIPFLSTGFDRTLQTVNLSGSQKYWLAAIYWNLSLVSDRQGSSERAIAYLQEALALQPQLAGAEDLLKLGNLWLEREDLDEAAFSFQQALQLQPNYVEAYVNLGIVWRRAGKYERAIASYRQAIALNPKLAMGYFSLGNVLYDLGRFAEAKESYQRAIDLKPGLIEAYFGLGNSLHQLDLEDEAIVAYLRAIELKPDCAEAYFYLVNPLANRGRLPEAIESSKQALRLKPDLARQCFPRDLWKDFHFASEAKTREHFTFVRCRPTPIGVSPASQAAGAATQTKPLRAIGRKSEMLRTTPGDRSSKNKTSNNQTICSSSRELAETESEIAYRQIYPPSKILLSSPFSLAKGPDRPVREVFSGFIAKSPAAFVAAIPEGRAWGDRAAALVVTRDNRLLADISNGGGKVAVVFSLKQLPPVYAIDGTVAFFSVQAGNYYYHWMLDVLPRLHLLRLSEIPTAAIDFFVFNDVAKSFQQETLNILGIPQEKIVSSQRLPHIQARRLVTTSIPTNIPKWSGEFMEGPPKWVCQFLRSEFLPLIQTKINTEKSGQLERIYINRQQASHRRVINETEAIALLEQFGFVSVSLESLSVLEQVELLANARFVVAPHGGGLTNLVFCQPGTKVIEIFSHRYVSSCYWLTSSHLDLEYYYLIGDEPDSSQSLPKNHLDAIFEDILVNLDDLKTLLDLAI